MENKIFIESINNVENRLLSLNKTWSKVFVLADENTQEYCLPFLFSEIDFFKEAEVIAIEQEKEVKALRFVIKYGK